MKSRILVVDDDLSILELLRTLLESEGYQVNTFASGAAALKSALRHPPDAAIIDLMMPGMNGLDLIQALRFDRRTNQLPVLICSAYYGDLRHITADLRHNHTTCLRKPFQLEELLDLVGYMVASHKQVYQGHDGSRQQLHPEVPTPIASAPGSWTPLITPSQDLDRSGNVPAEEETSTTYTPSLAAVRTRPRSPRQKRLNRVSAPGGETA